LAFHAARLLEIDSFESAIDSAYRGVSQGIEPLARFPIRWNHLIEKNSRQFKNLEHVLVGKAGPLFRDML
jgi:hypothetical protein